MNTCQDCDAKFGGQYVMFGGWCAGEWFVCTVPIPRGVSETSLFHCTTQVQCTYNYDGLFGVCGTGVGSVGQGLPQPFTY